MKRLILSLVFVSALVNLTSAQTPYMVKEIRSGWPGSYPFSLTAYGNMLLFSATDGTNGRELWRSDGTDAGTVMVKDIYIGTGSSMVNSSSDSDYMTPFGSKIYFAANDASNGLELWMTDGTDAGTQLVKDIYPGTTGSAPHYFSVMGNTLYFVADDGVNGEELWKTDGTASGTVMVKDINPGSGRSIYSGWGWDIPTLLPVGSYIYFPASGGWADLELWRSDGTLSGTTVVKDLPSNSASPQFLANVASTIFYNGSSGGNSDRELYRSDGTDAGTVLVKDINPGSGSSAPSNLIDVNGTLIFSADNGSSGVGRELWKSDGTDTGTVLIKDIYLGTNGSNITSKIVFQNKLIFTAEDGQTGVEPWISDGTSAGTTILKDIRSGTYGSNPEYFIEVGGGLYFAAGATHTIWFTDGTGAGTYSIGAAEPKYLTNVNGTIFFQGYNGDTGQELWALNTPTAVQPSVNEEILSVSIFPNPSQGEISIVIPEKVTGKTTYFVSDIYGRRLIAGNLNSVTTQIFLPPTDGIYFVCVSNSTQSHTEKIVVKR